jgi:hypothetical protein
MTNGKEQLRSGKPADEIEEQSKPVKVDDPAEGEELATGTRGGEHKTGIKGERPTGKGNLGHN